MKAASVAFEAGPSMLPERPCRGREQMGSGDGGSFDFELGAGHVIPGFDSAVSQMQVGEEKNGVRISAEDAYGSKGFKAMGIPADADLEYDLKVVSKN